MSYVPLHDRTPYFANLPSPAPANPHRPSTPGYAPPDRDPSIPWHELDGTDIMSDEDYDPDLSEEEDVGGPGPTQIAPQVARAVAQSRQPPATPPSYVKHSHQPSEDSRAVNGDPGSSSRKRRRLSEEVSQNGHGATSLQAAARPPRISPSFFNTAPRDPIIRTIGDFIMRVAEGKQNVEVEIKLGSLLNPPVPGAGGKMEQHRVRLPGMTEILVPTDYPVHKFESQMTVRQHRALNELLNATTDGSNNWRPDPSQPAHLQSKPWPIYYKRERQIDEFYQYEGQTRSGKVRVSRARGPNGEAGEVIDVIRKKRYADLNVANPGEAFDYRISLSTEEKCEYPSDMVIAYSRTKDRVSYKHQFCQVDLTRVEAQTWVEATAVAAGHYATAVSFELEVEIINVPTLLKEGQKEEAGQPNMFDEMLSSILGTVRMLIRNAPQA